jgi:hypothetical protein
MTDMKEAVRKAHETLVPLQGYIAEGTHLFEVEWKLLASIKDGRRVLKGESDNNFEDILNFMGGRRRVPPVPGRSRFNAIQGIIFQCETMLEQCRKKMEDTPCGRHGHNWLLRRAVQPGLSPPYLELECGTCQSLVCLTSSHKEVRKLRCDYSYILNFYMYTTLGGDFFEWDAWYRAMPAPPYGWDELPERVQALKRLREKYGPLVFKADPEPKHPISRWHH